jgi:N,N-dimethylformamidase
MKKIAGYSDEISVFPGGRISFMVSCDGPKSYTARIVRIIHGDTSPEGPGFKEKAVKTGIDGKYRGRKQEIYAGSHVVVPNNPHFEALSSFTVQAMIWPTTPETGRQALITRWDGARRSGFRLEIDEAGALALVLGDGKGKVEEIGAGKAMVAREWYFVAASFDAKSRKITVYQEPLVEHAKIDSTATVTKTLKMGAVGRNGAALVLAARHKRTTGGRRIVEAHYNGKIDSPRLANQALGRMDMARLMGGALPDGLMTKIVGAWDFSRQMATEAVEDMSPNRLHGTAVNMPARAMKGYNWTGTEMNWRHAPDQYGAIHFHDDDIHDAGWDVDFTLTVPKGLKSGLYAAHVVSGQDEEYMPFVVRARPGTARAKAVFIVPTASYMAYANEHLALDAPIAQLLTGQVPVLYPHDVFLHEHREYGASCYDTHSDGSGICYSSRLRPILNMRPKYASWLGGAGSSLWQFNADTHILDWLDALGYDVDCVTDEDLHYDGVESIADYKVVLTGTHPEYWSTPMWDALEAFKQRGGRLMYLGANGWYWRIAYHETSPGIMEVRRGEDGIRAWAAEPGEYYHSFNDEYGGLWRRQGRPPQMMGGTGFTAQGFDISSYYRRLPDSFDPRARFIFKGVKKDELIGDFGLIGGGAAGLELDRADRLLGTPPNALVLASSENHTDIYMVVCEEILINYPAITGSSSPLVRADMVFYELPGGGAVFSTSSIAWAGSLSENNYKNNVSRITANVLDRFLDEKPF